MALQSKLLHQTYYSLFSDDMDFSDLLFYSDHCPKTIVIIYIISLTFIETVVILGYWKTKLIRIENNSLKPLWLFRKSNLIPLSVSFLVYYICFILTAYLPTILYFMWHNIIPFFLEDINLYSIFAVIWLGGLFIIIFSLFSIIIFSPIALIFYVLSFIIIFLIRIIIIGCRAIATTKKGFIKSLIQTFNKATLHKIFEPLTAIFGYGSLCFIVYLMYLFTKQFDAALYGNYVSNWLNGILQNNWQTLLIFTLGPIVIILLCYIVLALVNTVLIFREKSFLKHNKIHFCCPKCGSSSYDYIVNEKVYPIPLSPNIYGTMYHNVEGQRIPTLIVNGKDKLERRCRECGRSIFPHKEKHSLVSDVHVSVIGTSSSGKSWLMIYVLYRMLIRFGKRAYQIDVCPDNNIKTIFSQLYTGGVFNFDTGANDALQIIVERKHSIIPWLLYWWEHNDSTNIINFYKNVSKIIFVIDPLSTLYNQFTPSPTLQHMLNRNQSGYSVDRILQGLDLILDTVGRNSQEIDVIVTLTKADTGYIEHTLGISYKTASSEDIKRFVTIHMGANNLVNNLNNMFASVTYAAIGLVDSDASVIDSYINTVFSKLVKA